MAISQQGPDGSGLDMQLLVLETMKKQIRADAVGRVFLLVFILYPGLTSKIFAAFACRRVDEGISVLHIDYNIECEATVFIRVFGAGSLVLFWSIGLPGLLFFLMLRVKKQIFEDDEVGHSCQLVDWRIT
jgi:hypothetical protein